MPPKLVLVTDLDGTFLGGPGQERLYSAIERHRDDMQLIFATGRSLADVVRHFGWGDAPAAYGGPPPPRPDYLICDVGTAAYFGAPPHAEVPGVMQWIRESWGDAGDRVRSLLQDVPGLELQGGGSGWEEVPVPVEGGGERGRSPRPRGTPTSAGRELHRISYYFTPDCDIAAVCARCSEAGFDAIASHGKFLDVLPSGVGKGTTMQRLLRECGLDPATAVVAGDSCNDLGLFNECRSEGPTGVVVGNADQQLRDTLAQGERCGGIYFANAHGAGGIWEALTTHYGHSWLADDADPPREDQGR
eukprot:TRINITY_DN35068_c0_g1_i1.p1 TRINITY_DN35068_c0_g1~~TRINITY_DN35068_c0_g1_i1.p1  ORF type:complete len:303 (+),score=68.07 TRINITY_DN35068_c0_g1_i1:119-1027(+)